MSVEENQNPTFIQQAAAKLMGFAYETAVSAYPEFYCPKCHETYPAPKATEVSFPNGLFRCPHCGFEKKIMDLINDQRDFKVNPPGAQSKPEFTTIQQHFLPTGDMVFQIPAARAGSGLIGFGVLWTSITTAIVVVVVFSLAKTPGDLWFPILFLMLFEAIGLTLLYFGLSQRYARHMLYVGADKVSLQTDFFGRKKIRSLPSSSIEFIGQSVFYSQNKQPVYGIEIRSRDQGSLKFGTLLRNEEKCWIVWETRKALKIER